jgi:hypothetical protein
VPPPEQDFPHVAVLWVRLGTDRRGNPLLAAPVEVPCRWVYSNRISQDQNGEAVTLTATAKVDRMIPVGSLMWRGTFADMPAGTGPWAAGSQPSEVLTYEEADDVRAREVYREVGMGRWRASPPAGV